jgi:hypothetical protein
MDTSEMKQHIKDTKSELKNTTYDNFAEKHRRTNRPEELTSNFSDLLNQLEILVKAAIQKFPDSKVDSLFQEGKGLLDVKRRAVNNDDFQSGKETLLKVVELIEENLRQEETENQPPVEHDKMNRNTIQSQPKNIFVSYYKEEILDEIKTVLEMLGTLDPKMDNLPYTARSQSSSLDTLIQRNQDISLCSSAIICLPPPTLSEDSNDNSTSIFAYFDLGAFLASFPKRRTLLVHQGNQIPDNFSQVVETFHYQGNLDFKTGMELARQILKVLQTDH